MSNNIRSMSADWTESEWQQYEDQHGGRMEHFINVGNTERIISGAAGGMLLYNGLSGIGKHPVAGLFKTLLGGFLLYRGASGNCPVYTAIGKTNGVFRTRALSVRTSIVVDKPREEVYAFWRKLENLPLFMKHLERVQEQDDINSTWTANLPGFGRLVWGAMVVKDIPGHLIGWMSDDGAPLENAGKVEFIDNGPGSTEVKVVITYRPPAGDVGVAIAQALNPAFKKVIQGEIEGFKDRIERVVW